ncbi:hypothetical protein ACU4GD_29290 [Cupriavidus basilensis]
MLESRWPRASLPGSSDRACQRASSSHAPSQSSKPPPNEPASTQPYQPPAPARPCRRPGRSADRAADRAGGQQPAHAQRRHAGGTSPTRCWPMYVVNALWLLAGVCAGVLLLRRTHRLAGQHLPLYRTGMAGMGPGAAAGDAGLCHRLRIYRCAAVRGPGARLAARG